MATSISKAQADALAEGFFDDLGSDEGLQPKNSLSALFQLAGGMVESAQRNLISSNNIARGKLSESLKILDPKVRGKTIRVDMVMNFYGQFINKGVKGVNKGTGGYSFKFPNPSRKHVAAMEAYIRRSGKSVSNAGLKSNKNFTYGKQEAKNKKISFHSSAYALAKSIKQNGIKKTGFLDKAIQTTKSKASTELAKGLKLDIIDSLPNKLG